MQYRSQSLSNHKAEVDVLMHRFYSVDDKHADLPDLDLDWDHYHALEAQDILLLVTARDPEDKLVGMNLYIIGAHPHYKNDKWAFCDTLAVDPDYRGQGIGKTLVKSSMLLLKERGVRYTAHGYRALYNTEPLFTRLGFMVMDHTYVKELV